MSDGVSSSASVNVVSCDVSNYVYNYHHGQRCRPFQRDTQPSSAQTVIESRAQMRSWVIWFTPITTYEALLYHCLFLSSLKTRIMYCGFSPSQSGLWLRYWHIHVVFAPAVVLNTGLIGLHFLPAFCSS